MTTRYIGIDCGLDGAIVTIEGERILEMLSMPTKKVGTKREIDIDVLAKLFDSQFKRDFCFASVEDPGGHAPSAAGLRSMTYSFANEIWTDTNWRRTPRSRIPFDGFVDAALIAEYARRMQG